MTDNQTNSTETFEDFKKSFSYGSRSDLNFKFLAGLSDEDAGVFFQDLLKKLGESFDDGGYSRLVEHVIHGQVQAYSMPGKWTYQEAPFTPLSKPLTDSRLALFTSTGHFVDGEDPEPFGVKNMTQEEAARRISEFMKAEPNLTSIPIDIPPTKLQVRHGGYDIRGVQADRNVALPIDRLREFAEEGVIGGLLPHAYSFVGAAAQLRIINDAGPKWVEMLKSQDVEAVLLVPVWPVCHVSVGHVARLLEAAGMPTVIVAVKAFRPRMEVMRLPRLLLTPHPMGRPLGLAGDVERQREVLLTAFDLLETVTQGGTMVEFSE